LAKPKAEIREFSFYYGAKQALRGITMPVEDGAVTALIGPSGCGKSTLLRAFNRMHDLTPDTRYEGEIILHPDDVNIVGPGVDPIEVRMRIGMVFQKPNPFPAMSIYENVLSGLKMTGKRIGQSEKDDIVEEMLIKGGLWSEVSGRLREPGGSLSGGQQQRLCIARSLAVRPKVLLMDEPCSALDPVATLAVEDLIGELKSKDTIAIVTHNMQQAARASDITAFFNLEETGQPGRLVEIGPTEKIFTQPSEQATEDYVSGRFG